MTAWWENRDPRAGFGETAVKAAEDIKAIASGLGVTETTAELLWLRGQKDSASAGSFLRKEVEIFHDAFLMKDMDKAVARITEALSAREKITIYGDYDVDGVTSVSALYLYLCDAGADIDYYIPSRDKEGYGVNNAALDAIADSGTKLVITVDTGITAVDEVAYAKSRGVDVIVTDHHECLILNGVETIPEAAAVVNPRRSDCGYPFGELAGVGVVFKLLCALEKTRHGGSDYLREIVMKYGDLVAIGTVADVMPLVDENRLIVSMGMSLIEESPRAGLSALLDASGAPASKQKKRRITSGTIGFTVAPRINAVGRIANATRAVELFLEQDPLKAAAVASELCETNRRRQLLENEIAEQASAMIAESGAASDRVIVLTSDSWHQGVIGIVASRITEKYGLPAILITFDGDTGKGSGRSVKGLNLVEALQNCSDCLIRFGGHELAAGLSIERGKVDEFRRRINEYAASVTGGQAQSQTVSVDCELRACDITLPQASELYLLEPYGVGNPVPLFLLREAGVAEITPIGSARHTRFTLEKDGVRFTAVWFGAQTAELDLAVGDKVDLAFNLDINDFMNIRSVQLIVRKLTLCERTLAQRESQRQIYTDFIEGLLPAPEDTVPNRNDFAAAYVFLRYEIKNGRSRIFLRRVEDAVRSAEKKPGSFRSKPVYAKTRFIIDAMRETGLITAEPCPTDDGAERFDFSVPAQSGKIDLENSQLYRRLLHIDAN